MKHTMVVIDGEVARQQELRPDEMLTHANFAERMGVDASMFSRWRSGQSEKVNRETLTSMLLGFSDDDTMRARLLCAYLVDQKQGQPGEEMVVVGVQESGRIREQPETAPCPDRFDELIASCTAASLDKRMTEVLTDLVQALEKNPALRRTLSSLAKLAR